MIFLRFRRFFFLVLIFTNTYSACVHDSGDTEDATTVFSSAKESYDDEHFEIAVQKLGEFKSRFPYSKYATEAELLIANSHFKLDNFEEAAIEYRHFVKLHPKHPNIDYAKFRVGMSYWQESSEDVDRDQELTKTAMNEWKNLIRDHPNSEYSSKAKELIIKGDRRMAENGAFVVAFYCKQEIYHGCAYRAIAVLEEYSHHKDINYKVIKLAAEAFKSLVKIKKTDPTSDANIFFKNMTIEQLQEKAEKFSKLTKSMKPAH